MHSLRLRRDGALVGVDPIDDPVMMEDHDGAYHAWKRAGIDGTISAGVRACGLRRSRSIREAKTHLQHLATAAALNISRISNWLLGEPREQTRTSAYAKLIRHWNVFDAYLESAAALDPVPALDEAAILAEHRAIIGEGTHFYRSREAMHYPPPVADEIIARMLQQGMIRKEVTQNRGILLSRIS